jgi:hypothetical protein
LSLAKFFVFILKSPWLLYFVAWLLHIPLKAITVASLHLCGCSATA